MSRHGLSGAVLLTFVLLPKLAFAAEVTTIQVASKCQALAIEGTLRFGEAPEIVKQIEEKGASCRPKVVFLHEMKGGSVLDAIEIGRYIRRQSLSTMIAGNGVCVSACGLIYVGGVRRYFESGGVFAIHKPKSKQDFLDSREEEIANDRLKYALMTYVSEMGAKPDYVKSMYEVSPNRVRILEERYLGLWQIVTSFDQPHWDD